MGEMLCTYPDALNEDVLLLIKQNTDLGIYRKTAESKLTSRNKIYNIIANDTFLLETNLIN